MFFFQFEIIINGFRDSELWMSLNTSYIFISLFHFLSLSQIYNWSKHSSHSK